MLTKQQIVATREAQDTRTYLQVHVVFTHSFYIPTGASVQDLGQLEENIRTLLRRIQTSREEEFPYSPAPILVIAIINPPATVIDVTTTLTAVEM